MGKKKNKVRNELFKECLCNLSDMEDTYNDTFDDSLWNGLIPQNESPLSIEEDIIFESLGKENLITSDASDYVGVDDIEIETEISLISEELGKKIRKTSEYNDRFTDVISNQLGETIVAKEVPKPSPEPQKILSRSRSTEKKSGLYDMEKEIISKATLIRHDGGLYYYTGKYYAAIRSDLELLELIRSKISSSAFAVTSTKPFQDLMMFLKTDPNLTPHNYENKLMKARKLVVLKNGVLNIATLELKGFDPKYLLFHSVSASWRTRCYPKVFLKFLRQSCNYDEEIVQLTTEMIGYLLSGSNQAKAFFVIGTAPDSGKSTLASLIKRLIGEEFVCSVEPNKLHERFALGSTRGKILNLALDIPQGRLCAAAVSKIKAITGNDSISIEEKYMRLENTVSSLRFLFGTNHPISLSSSSADDDAFWNRLIVIPFLKSVRPEDKDPSLLDKLWEERDAIVSYCLKSYRKVLNNDFTFSYCQASLDIKESWRHDDASFVSFANFWQDCVEVTGDFNDKIYSQTLYDQYLCFCQDHLIEPIYYTRMREWIEAHTDGEMCVSKRLHYTGKNPRAGYCGIKVNY